MKQRKNILLTLVAAGLASCSQVLAAVPPAPPPEPRGLPVPEAHGYNIHFTDPRPGEMEMIAASGVKWVRMDFTWGGTEREPGQYDFSAYDRLLAALDPHGLRALFILDYANRHYDGGLAPSTDAGRAAFAQWAAAAVTHFRGRGIVWELWNEPNLDGFWKPRANVTNYIALARAVGKALREAAPGETFVGPGVSRIDLPFLEACFRAGLLEEWDAVTVHPYRHQSGPETVVAEYGQLRDLIRQYAPAREAVPIMSGEWGFSSAWDGFDAAAQGAMLPRQWLVNAACGIPLSIWYDWHDDGRDPREAEHNFGTVSNAWHAGRTPVYDPKPAYLAATTLNRSLDGFRFARRLSPPRVGGESSPEDWVLLFRRGPEVRLAAWTTDAAGPGIRLAGVTVPAQVVAHTGGALPDLVPGADGLTVPLSRAPVYLRLPPDASAALETAVYPSDWADGRIASVTRTPGAEGTLLVTVAKAFGPPLRGRVLLAADAADAGACALALGAGVAQTTLVVRTTAPVAAALAVRVERSDGAVIYRAKARRVTPVADFPAPAAGFALHDNTDGKGTVDSTQAVAAVAAPPGMPTGATNALRVTAAIAAGYKYLCVVPREVEQAKVPGRPVALGVWVHAQGAPATVSCRLQDASGEVFQPAHVRLADGWQYVELRFTGQGGGHWGGNDNGIVDWPARWQALLLVDREHKQPYRGVLHFAGPALIDEP